MPTDLHLPNNLLINAEHAIRGHRGRGHVWLRLATSGPRAVITVADDGPGIPPELLDRDRTAGRGARFVVELPPLDAALRGTAEESPRRGRILVVDDEPDIRRSISRFLTRPGGRNRKPGDNFPACPICPSWCSWHPRTSSTSPARSGSRRTSG